MFRFSLLHLRFATDSCVSQIRLNSSDLDVLRNLWSVLRSADKVAWVNGWRLAVVEDSCEEVSSDGTPERWMAAPLSLLQHKCYWQLSSIVAPLRPPPNDSVAPLRPPPNDIFSPIRPLLRALRIFQVPLELHSAVCVSEGAAGSGLLHDCSFGRRWMDASTIHDIVYREVWQYIGPPPIGQASPARNGRRVGKTKVLTFPCKI